MAVYEWNFDRFHELVRNSAQSEYNVVITWNSDMGQLFPYTPGLTFPLYHGQIIPQIVFHNPNYFR